MAFNFSDVSNRSESRLKQWQELCRWTRRLRNEAIFVAVSRKRSLSGADWAIG